MADPSKFTTSRSPAPPLPTAEAGRAALQTLLRTRNVLATLEAVHHHMGDIFQMPLPGFKPVFLVGPEANRFVTVTGREDLRWRSEGDPVTAVLRQGLLVTDGELHDELRHAVMPPLHKHRLDSYTQCMVACCDQVSAGWADGASVDMLVEMRKAALLILMDTLFAVDFRPEMQAIWPALMKTLAYISPGLWLLAPGLPRPGYQASLRRMDQYLYEIIARRRAHPSSQPDLLSELIASGMPDGLIRDQLLTILIAGHDTSTALLAWTLHLLGEHPQVLQHAQAEVDQVLAGQPPAYETAGKLVYLEQVINESLRLYPPIHLGNRIAATDLEFQGYRIPAGTRVVYSIYLTHRQPRYWPEPERFDPERFAPEQARQRAHYTFVPFGGGPRNCIGLAFAQVEVKVVLARLLQCFLLEKAPGAPKVHAHMGATLEPRPGVVLKVTRR